MGARSSSGQDRGPTSRGITTAYGMSGPRALPLERQLDPADSPTTYPYEGGCCLCRCSVCTKSRKTGHSPANGPPPIPNLIVCCPSTTHGCPRAPPATRACGGISSSSDLVTRESYSWTAVCGLLPNSGDMAPTVNVAKGGRLRATDALTPRSRRGGDTATGTIGGDMGGSYVGCGSGRVWGSVALPPSRGSAHPGGTGGAGRRSRTHGGARIGAPT